MSIMARTLRTRLCALITLSLLTSNVLGDHMLSQSKDLGNNIDKRVIKTIETVHGDIYDCVDFYKQPAFDHPSLKNHNFHPQMRPSNRPKKTSSTQSYSKNHETPMPFGLKDKACPLGTVPISRKMEKNDINNRVESQRRNRNRGLTVNSVQDGVYVAVGRSKSPQVYHGVTTNLTIHKPSINEDEYSSGRVSIKNDPDSIKVGWRVDPTYYNDSEIRMFIYTETEKNSCYNTDCPGFVLVRQDIPVNSVLAPLSEPRDPLSYVDFFIYQDPKTKNWWLEVGHDGTPIGFWPQQIFTNLAESGSYVDCGGEVYHNRSKAGGVASMGGGFFPNKHVKSNAYCYNFEIVNQDNKIDMARDTEAYSDWPTQYGVEDKFIPKHDFGTNIIIEFEHIVVYGGNQHY